MGDPTPCFGDRRKLTDLVYRAVSPLRLDIPMRHVGRLYLSRLEHRPKSLWQDGRHTNSPQSLTRSMHFVIRISSASIKLRQYPPIPLALGASPSHSFDCGNYPLQSVITKSQLAAKRKQAAQLSNCRNLQRTKTSSMRTD